MKHKLNQVCYQNRYSQLDAESIMELASQSTDVKLLPSSKNYDLFTSFDEAGDLVCNGEVITLGKARYANIKYWYGDFISSNNNIIESKNTNFLRSKYLYYFLSYTSKDYYVEATTYPKFDQRSFDNHTIDIPSIDTQDSRLNILDSLTDLINKETLQLEQLDELTKSRFIEMFGDVESNTHNYPIKKLNEISEYWNGLTYKPTDVVDNEKGTLVLRSSNVQNGQLCFDDNVFVNCQIKERHIVKENDILMCSRNGSPKLVGKVALVRGLNKPTSFGAFMMIIRSSYYHYLKLFFESAAFKHQISTGTATINQITGNMLNTIKLPVPPMIIIDEFAEFVKQIDKLKFNVQQRIEKYKELLNKKMSEYFN